MITRQPFHDTSPPFEKETRLHGSITIVRSGLETSDSDVIPLLRGTETSVVSSIIPRVIHRESVVIAVLTASSNDVCSKDVHTSVSKETS